MALHLCEPLRAQQYLVLASALSERPHSSLRVFDIASPSFSDLAFLEYFSTVEQLQLETGCALDPALFRSLNPDLKALRVQAGVHLSSVEQLQSFSNLRTLQITGRLKTYEGLSNLRSLDEVGLTNANDDAVEELGGFEALSILNLVGRSVSSLKPLEGRTIGSLSVRESRRLTDLTSVTAIRGIAALAVTGLTRLERLPDLSALTELRWLELAWLPRLADVTPMISSTSLRYLMLFNMDQVKAQHLRETLDRSTVEVATLLHQAGGDGRSSPLPRMRDAGLPFESRFA